jgi:peroxiredoxin
MLSRRLFELVCMLAVFALSAPAFAQNLVGKTAPAFSLVDQNGKTHTLADYSGKTVVLEWTNPGCPFVVRHYEAGTMKRVAESAAKDDVVWLAVNSSHFTEGKESTEWAKKHGHTFLTLHDADGKVGKAYGAVTTPHMYVVDAQGLVAYEGAIDSDAWVKDAKATNYVVSALADLKAKRAVAKSHVKPYGCSVKYKR